MPFRSSSSVRADFDPRWHRLPRCCQVAGRVLVRIRAARQRMAANTGLGHLGYAQGRKTAADVWATLQDVCPGQPPFQRKAGLAAAGRTRCRSTARTLGAVLAAVGHKHGLTCENAGIGARLVMADLGLGRISCGITAESRGVSHRAHRAMRCADRVPGVRPLAQAD